MESLQRADEFVGPLWRIDWPPYLMEKRDGARRGDERISCASAKDWSKNRGIAMSHVIPSLLGLANRASRLPSHPPAQSIVFVVDDDVFLLRSLELLIDSAGWQSETFCSAQQFLARPRPCTPSCLVLDVLLPDFNGLDLQEHLATDRIAMPIIFITGHGDVPMSVRAMKGGAEEFLTKPFRDDLLLGAIARALEQSRAALADHDEMRALRECHASLSRREREVMALVVSGRLNKQVGSELGISEITVKAHRGKVMQKMRARSLPDLVKMAARLEVAPPLKR
jgi:FixJ family two-component response regulator